VGEIDVAEWDLRFRRFIRSVVDARPTEYNAALNPSANLLQAGDEKPRLKAYPAQT
jgi:hypothetical protein